MGACALGVLRLIQGPHRPAGAGEAAAEERYRRGAAIALWLAVCGFGIPLVLALGGADYLAPRNVLGAMVPVAALIAVLATWPRTWPFGAALLALGTAGLLAITLDIDLSPRLQRGDWRGLARTIPAGGPERAYTTVLFGSAPLAALHTGPEEAAGASDGPGARNRRDGRTAAARRRRHASRGVPADRSAPGQRPDRIPVRRGEAAAALRGAVAARRRGPGGTVGARSRKRPRVALG